MGGLPRRDSKERLPELGWVEMAGQYYLSLEVQRASNVEVDLAAEVSGDLNVWESGGAAVTVVSENPGSLLVRDNMPLWARKRADSCD